MMSFKRLLKKNYLMIIKKFFFKFFQGFKFFIELIFFFPFLINFIYFNRKKKINIILIRSSSLGHLLTESLCYLVLKKNNENNFFFHEDKISNYFLMGLLKKNIKINQKLKYLYFICNLFTIAKIKCYNLHDYAEKKFSIDLNRDYQKIFFNQKKFKIKFTAQEKNKAKIFLKKYKIDLRSKFVIIATRDQNFKRHVHGNNFVHHESRNYDPKNLKLIIKDLINKNFKVIRIAQFSDPIHITKSKNFIDINFLNKEMDFLYFLLIQKAFFFIGVPSGPLHIAQFFRKNIFCINALPYKVIFDLYKMMIVPKKMVINNKLLNIKEIFNKNLENYLGFENTKKFHNIKYIENNPMDLLNAYSEFEKIISNPNHYKKLKKINYKFLKKSLNEQLFLMFKKTNNVLPASFFKG
tara:strand:+ start:25834 stop:27060 length:1227 start_codon:yes stop_codon:yes gene_type:complete